MSTVKKCGSLGEALCHARVLVIDGVNYDVDYIDSEMLEDDAKDYAIIATDEDGDEIMFDYVELEQFHKNKALEVLTLVPMTW